MNRDEDVIVQVSAGDLVHARIANAARTKASALVDL